VNPAGNRPATVAGSLPQPEPAELIVTTASQLFLDRGFTRVSMAELAAELGMSKKTIYRHFPDKRSLLVAALDRLFAEMETALNEAVNTEAEEFTAQVERFLLAAGGQLSRIRAPQLELRRRDAVLSLYVDKRVEVLIYQRIDRLFRVGRGRGVVQGPPELLTAITRGAFDELLGSDLAHELDWSAADLLRTVVATVLHGVLQVPPPAHPTSRSPQAPDTGSTDDQEKIP
jgi:AcrR family transcriptional regulator